MNKLSLAEIKTWAHRQHDIECNQKYGNAMPYSNHLDHVNAQAVRFISLLSEKEFTLALAGCDCHDLIEDARVSYNEIADKFGKDLAEIVFLCTEMRGRNRNERHSEEFYKQLATDKVAVFVKMCDIIANVTYSTLTNSTMLNKYSIEYYSRVRLLLYRKDLDRMFTYLERLFKLQNYVGY